MVVIIELLMLYLCLEHHLVLVTVSEILLDGLIRAKLNLTSLGYIMDASRAHRRLLWLQAHFFIIDF